jgi:hypothetical protein
VKRTLSVAAFLLAVLLMAAVGVVVGRALSGGPGGGQDAGMSCVGRASWLSSTLELSPDQSAAIGQLEQDYQAVLAGQCALHCATKARLFAGLFAAPAEAPPTEQLLDTLAAVQRTCDLATLDHIRRIHDLLTPAQQARFCEEVIASACVCGSGLHECRDAAQSPAAGGAGATRQQP